MFPDAMRVRCPQARSHAHALAARLALLRPLEHVDREACEGVWEGPGAAKKHVPNKRGARVADYPTTC